MPHDVRAIANFVLDVAEETQQIVSNMKINKIVYFLHVDYLVEFKTPLVKAKIEAWEHGPVFRELYSQFRNFGDQGISTRATTLNPQNGQREKARYALKEEEAVFLRELATRYSSLSAAALRAQSHIEGGPWDKIWNHEGLVSPTMQITDEAILDWYGRSAKH